MTADYQSARLGRAKRRPAGKIEIHKPLADAETALAFRKAEFTRINRDVSDGGGWITSLPGGRTVTIECLPHSSIPAALTANGIELIREPDGQRIIGGAIVEKLTQSSSGALIRATEGSTGPVVEVSHAGICAVHRYSFSID
jgi:hypothetical protein